MRTAALGLIACFSGGMALAAPVMPALPPKEVAAITVYPKTEPPRIVKSFPAEGQAVAGGVLVLTVTFDQPMIKTGFDFTAAPGGEAPECLKTPRLLNDGKTFVLLCTTRTKADYAIAFNANPEGGFSNVTETRARPAVLAFRTTEEWGARDVHAALKAANLREIDMPIQEQPDRRPEPAPPNP